MLEELVESNAAITATNAELLSSVDSLIKSDDKLSCRLGNRRNNRTRDYSPAPGPKTLCPHCKIEVMYASDNCFSQNKNANRGPRGWKVICDNGGHLK